MKTKLVAVIALIFCAFMAEASKVEGNGNIITKEISVDNYSEIEPVSYTHLTLPTILRV